MEHTKEGYLIQLDMEMQGLDKKKADLQKEKEFLKNTTLDIIIYSADVGDNKKTDYITRDYSLANKLEMFRLGNYGGDEMIINFIYEMPTEEKTIKIYCKHKGWFSDNMRWAQRRFTEYEDGSEPERHDINELCEFYAGQGVKKELVEELRAKVTEIYNPKIDEEDFQAAKKIVDAYTKQQGKLAV